MPLRALPLLLVSSVGLPGQPSGEFKARDAVLAEWNRAMPALSADQVAQLPPADRARYERSLARIGAPGAPDLLPPELAHPTKEAWEDLARKAKTPQERFTALFFLNRFKAPDALAALDGLTAGDAKIWPKHLHLEAQIATARINGGEVSPGLQGFLDAMQKEGKVDPVRAQAARLRLVIAGKESDLLPNLQPTPNNVLALVDVLNGPVLPERRKRIDALIAGNWESIGLSKPSKEDISSSYFTAWRCMELDLPSSSTDRLVDGIFTLHSYDPSLYFCGFTSFLPRLSEEEWDDQSPDLDLKKLSPVEASALLPELRKAHKPQADLLRALLIRSTSSVARAAAIDDLPEAPADLDALAKCCFNDTDMESALELFASLDRWKLSADRRKAILTPFLEHPDWGWRYQAWLQLRKTEPGAPWPSSPIQRPMDKALLVEATRLAERGKPVRLCITFSGKRVVTLKLDPSVAPMNVANLVLLAKRRFFDGHRVPRVVPDFVVQMGSPLDTMDGGPGYSVRCEDSTVWYGPGSVGMALAGKDTGGCQFFITTNATPHLTGKYTRMGEVEHPDHDLKILDELELGAKIESIRVLE